MIPTADTQIPVFPIIEPVDSVRAASVIPAGLTVYSHDTRQYWFGDAERFATESEADAYLANNLAMTKQQKGAVWWVGTLGGISYDASEALLAETLVVGDPSKGYFATIKEAEMAASYGQRILILPKDQSQVDQVPASSGLLQTEGWVTRNGAVITGENTLTVNGVNAQIVLQGVLKPNRRYKVQMYVEGEDTTFATVCGSSTDGLNNGVETVQNLAGNNLANRFSRVKDAVLITDDNEIDFVFGTQTSGASFSLKTVTIHELIIEEQPVGYNEINLGKNGITYEFADGAFLESFGVEVTDLSVGFFTDIPNDEAYSPDNGIDITIVTSSTPWTRQFKNSTTLPALNFRQGSNVKFITKPGWDLRILRSESIQKNSAIAVTEFSEIFYQGGTVIQAPSTGMGYRNFYGEIPTFGDPSNLQLRLIHLENPVQGESFILKAGNVFCKSDEVAAGVNLRCMTPGFFDLEIEYLLGLLAGISPDGNDASVINSPPRIKIGVLENDAIGPFIRSWMGSVNNPEGFYVLFEIGTYIFRANFEGAYPVLLADFSGAVSGAAVFKNTHFIAKGSIDPGIGLIGAPGGGTVICDLVNCSGNLPLYATDGSSGHTVVENYFYDANFLS